MNDQQTTDGGELDVRPLRKPDKHPAIFATYGALAPGASFVLVNDHDPRHLREELEAQHAGNYEWEYLTREPRNYRIRIRKLAADGLPRVPVDTLGPRTDLLGSDAESVPRQDSSGANSM